MPAVKTTTKTVQFRNFKDGLNKTDARTGIRDTQLFWNENVQPIGAGQQTILPPAGPFVTSISPAIGFVSIWGVNIKIAGAEVARIMSINGDGSIGATDPLTGLITLIAAPGTVSALCRLAVWEDGPVIFADPAHGVFLWDGSTFLPLPHSVTGDTTSGSAVITNIGSTLGLAAGMGITGAGIPPGAEILSVDSPTQLTLDRNATATATGVTFTTGTGIPITGARDVAVFQGRVWLLVGLRSIVFSAPGSYTDFTASSGGGVTTIPDSVFVGSITRLLSALELLWIVGPAAVNAISNVQAAGSPVVTTFSNTNIVASVGSVRPSSVISFFRTFLFVADTGIYAIVGATPQKLSDDLDGLFPFLKQTADQVNSAGVFSLNRVFVAAWLFTYIDPARTERPLLLCFARNSWFLASQRDDMIYITTVVDPTTGEQQLWGCTATGLFRCFAGTEPGRYLWQTKLWDFGAFTQIKQALRTAFEFFSESGEAIDAQVFIENEIGSEQVALTILNQNAITWIGDNGLVVTFIGDNGLPIIWTTAGFALARADNINLAGHYLGWRVQGQSLPFTISALALEYDVGGEWT
jgi:hypothetical protein